MRADVIGISVADDTEVFEPALAVDDERGEEVPLSSPSWPISELSLALAA